MDKATIGGRITLADLIDLYNFQDGPYRTTRKSDLIVAAMYEIFPELSPALPIYRGTMNKDEVESMIKAGKTIVDHAISFSTDFDLANCFGKFKFVVEENDGAVCIDLQKYVSAFLQACEDFGVGAVYSYARRRREADLLKFKQQVLDKYLSQDELETLDAERLSSRKKASMSTQTIYKMFEITVKLHSTGFDFAENNMAGSYFDPIDVGDEHEVLVHSDTVFDYVGKSDKYINVFIFRMRRPGKPAKNMKISDFRYTPGDNGITIDKEMFKPD